MTKVLFVISLMFLSIDSWACGFSEGWVVPQSSMPALSIDAAKSLLNSESGVDVVPGPSYDCDSDIYFNVLDNSDKTLLGTIPVPYQSTPAIQEKEYGRYIVVRTRQLLTTSKTQLRSLTAAQADFYKESKNLENEFALSFYIPNALDFQDRIKGLNYLIYASTPLCGSSSSETLSPQVFIKTVEYIAGRTDYSEGTIYKKGDLRKLLLNADFFKIYEDRVLLNLKTCTDKYDAAGTLFNPVGWAYLNNRIELESRQNFLRTSYERFIDMKKTGALGKILDAYFTQVNQLRMTVDRGVNHSEEFFGGESFDLLEIERDLKKDGIVVDRNTRLNVIGKFEKEHGKFPKPLDPVPN